MKIRLKIFCLFMCWAVTACWPASGGPLTEILQPTADMNLPFATILFAVESSDADGINYFEFYVDNQHIFNIQAGNTKYASYSFSWKPPAPGVYTVRVRAVDVKGNIGPFDEEKITIGLVSITNTPTFTPIANTSTPPIIVTIPVTKEPSTGCEAKIMMNANCREGPSTSYNVKDILTKGDAVQVLGCSADRGWLYVNNPKSGKECWIAISTLQTDCDINTLPVIPAPPLPKPAETETPTVPPVTPPPPPHPILTIISVDPTELVVGGSECTNYPKTTTVYAVVTGDWSQVVNITVLAEAPQGLVTQVMTHVGGGTYQATIGPFSQAGLMEIYVTAKLTDGAILNAGGTDAQIINCIE